MKNWFTILCAILSTVSYAQPRPVKVLFIGNSYTYYNSLPQILTGVAASMGDVVVADQSTVGGYTLRQHTSNTTTLDKIKAGTPDYNNKKARSSWDYVVIQEHSQLPSNPKAEILKDTYPYVDLLDSTIHAHNPDAKLIFYRTWGRKNGDQARSKKLPQVGTYAGMDSLTALTYQEMAIKYNGLLSPVGAVWKYIRDHHPTIELYNEDESHPSEAGSYAAACTFYSILFKKDPESIPFNYTLNSRDASAIRRAVKVAISEGK